MDELQRLREENARLKTLLKSHGIAWGQEVSIQNSSTETLKFSTSRFSTANKVALFRRLFRGRADVYAQRWESVKGASGYSPSCSNEWQPGICHKPKIKCGECNHRLLSPLNDQVIFDHLIGKLTVGVYPLLNDDSCYFLAVDFDEADWRGDAKAFMQSCRELNVAAALEVSRSGNGAHVWIFFTDSVPAREARQLGAMLISHTCDRTRQLSLASYDRFFPNQDFMPKGGYGNLIALPLQKQPRESGRSVFVDEGFHAFTDQWAFLASLKTLSRTELADVILLANGGQHPLDVAYASEEDSQKPWQRTTPITNCVSGPLPEALTLVLANQIFIAKADMPQTLSNRLIRLAAFQNPEFYKAQAMRLPVWNKPRIIGCAENFPQHIGLPRGCLDAILDLLKQNNIRVEIQDERKSGNTISVEFNGKLRSDQQSAVNVMLQQETGILCAPTAFGKTVTAAAMIAQRKVSTLVLVHRSELLRQWRERLTSFLEITWKGLGVIGGGKKQTTGKIDIAVMQSLSNWEDLPQLLDGYGQIIIDECHHLSAFSFEAILKQAKAKYIVGLTATPVRRDGHQPIIFMQCGPLRYTVAKSDTGPTQLEVWPQYLDVAEIPDDSAIQDVFRLLANNTERNQSIARDVLSAYQEGRKILVLTERTEHLELLYALLHEKIEHCFVLHGRTAKKQRANILAELVAFGDSTPHVLLATGRLIGEGFDHPPLDTLVLAMPISWKGTLQQYAGRLHREHVNKQDVRIYDYIDTNNPQLVRMWDKRQRGYRAMEYQMKSAVD